MNDYNMAKKKFDEACYRKLEEYNRMSIEQPLEEDLNIVNTNN